MYIRQTRPLQIIIPRLNLNLMTEMILRWEFTEEVFWRNVWAVIDWDLIQNVRESFSVQFHMDISYITEDWICIFFKLVTNNSLLLAANTVETEVESSIPLIIQTATGHDPEPRLSISVINASLLQSFIHLVIKLKILKTSPPQKKKNSVCMLCPLHPSQIHNNPYLLALQYT